MRSVSGFVAGAVAAALLVACTSPTPSGDGRLVDGGNPQFSDPTAVTHPLFPMGTVTQVVQLGVDGGSPLRVEVTLMPETRRIEWDGRAVETIVSQFISYRDGRVLEVAYDYFAQADDGSVWYFGEQVDNYSGGEIGNHRGAWLAGVDGPPGMIMPAKPRRDDIYRPENIPGIVYEEVIVLETDVTASGPSGNVTGAIRVEEHLLEGTSEQKLFAPGYGEFRIEAATELVDVAFAAPTDSRKGPVPAGFGEIIEAARRVDTAAAADDWDSATSALDAITRAWADTEPRTAPQLLGQQMANAIDALTASVAARDAASSRQAAFAAGIAAADLGLPYEEPATVDLERMALWSLRVTADAADGAAVLGDVAVLETIWDRARHAVDRSSAESLDARLTELRAAADTRGLDAIVVAARALLGDLEGLRSPAR
ncbi:MAG TPA: hypothetical protein VF365_09285 [Candidatus Limnocylindria bacterium]